MPQDTRIKVYCTDDSNYLWIAKCQYPECTWYWSDMSTSEEAWDAGEEHWEAVHVDNEPEDVARTELDKGLKDLDNLDQISTKNELKPVLQQDAQLHLLASIATSLYEIRTAGLRVLEQLAMPQAAVQDSQEVLEGQIGQIRRGLEQQMREHLMETAREKAQGMSQEDLERGDLMCKQCPHTVKNHEEKIGCTVTVGYTEMCDCMEPGFEKGPMK